MKKHFLFLSVTLFLLFHLKTFSFAQPDSSKDKTYFWLNFGAGPLNAKSFPGFAVYLGASIHSKGKKVTIKYCTSARLSGYFEPCNSTTYLIRPYKIKEFAVLFGMNPRIKYLSFSALTGLSYVCGKEQVKYNLDHSSGGIYITSRYKNFKNIGFPIEISLTLLPLPGIGISGVLSLNVNNSHFFTGTFFVIKFGYIRAK